MSSAPPKFFLTTPIYYVNARPHIGHAYTTIVADVLARRHRAQGDDTFFLTGTDEHGQKIERSAAAAGIPPQQFADQVSAQFRALWDRMGLTYDRFIRTTDEAHKRGVQQLFATLYQRGQIYLSTYTGQYCVSEEMFVEGPPGTIGPDGRPTETVTEENFFFRLSDFQLPLLNLIESDTLKITPEARKNEVLSFLRGNVDAVLKPETARVQAEHNAFTQPVDSDEPDGSGTYPAGPSHNVTAILLLVEQKVLAMTARGTPYLPGALKDLSVSRSSFTWGIPVPPLNPPDALEPEGHAFTRAINSPAEGGSALPKAAPAKDHVIYVWLDALANYMTALGYGSDDPADLARFEKYWPADLHLVGKEIIRFHCVYWPAFLMAAGLPLPKAITAHGWLLFEDSKMSKSKGNIVRTETILDAFGTLCPLPPAPTEEPHNVPPFTTLEEARKVTPSGVPQSATPPLLSSRSEAEGSASRLSPNGPLAPTPHDRDLFAADVLRYFLLREIPFGQDGSFSFDALVTRYNADLANGYGNLVSRTLKMIEKYFDGKIPEIDSVSPAHHTVESKARSIGFIGGFSSDALKRSGEFFDKFDFAGFLTGIGEQIRWADREILDLFKPWQERENQEVTTRVRSQALYQSAEMIRLLTVELHPILPYATTRVWQQLGLNPLLLTTPNSPLTTLEWGLLPPGTKLGPLSPIFPRADKKLIETMTQMEQDKNSPIAHANAAHDASTPEANEFKEAPIASQPPAASTDPAAPPRTSSLAEPNPGAQVAASTAVTTGPDPSLLTSDNAPLTTPADASPQTVNQITIDDFAKIELRVAKILVAERIPKADKLLRLEVDLGYEKRQILSGIAEHYTPEELLGRRIVVITNLAPRKMRGLESHGMLLAASAGDHGKPVLATFPDSDAIPLGSRLK